MERCVHILSYLIIVIFSSALPLAGRAYLTGGWCCQSSSLSFSLVKFNFRHVQNAFYSKSSCWIILKHGTMMENKMVLKSMERFSNFSNFPIFPIFLKIQILVNFFKTLNYQISKAFKSLFVLEFPSASFGTWHNIYGELFSNFLFVKFWQFKKIWVSQWHTS